MFGRAVGRFEKRSPKAFDHATRRINAAVEIERADYRFHDVT